MSTTAIRADFPLGTFLGHQDVGRAAPFPDTVRLHSALMHAAGKGVGAVERDGDLRPSHQSLAALRWLETHPPQSVAQPAHMATAARSAQSWRKEGVFESQKKPVERKTQRSQSDAVAVAGPFAWVWDDMPEEIVDALQTLVADVSCLGEADSPVILRVITDETITATHAIDAHQSGFPSVGGVAVRTPITGRVDELEADYERAHPSKPLSAAKDRFSWGQQPASHVPSSTQVRALTYRPLSTVTKAPWVDVVVIEALGDPPTSFTDPRRAVEWSVAFHRALVSQLGDLAPPLITGAYATGVRPPANRVAIHLLPSTPLAESGLSRAAYLLLVPAAAEPEELAALHRALARLKTIRRRVDGQVERVHLGDTRVVPADTFWQPPRQGTHRFWRPVPALVPEVRRQRGGQRRWDLSHAALLSMGHAFRDRFTTDGERPSRLELVERVSEAGASVHEAHLIPDSRIARYAHKVPDGLVVHPYTALLDLGGLVSTRTLVALGQSRHLGGGLLYPEDIADAVASVRGLV